MEMSANAVNLLCQMVRGLDQQATPPPGVRCFQQPPPSGRIVNVSTNKSCVFGQNQSGGCSRNINVNFHFPTTNITNYNGDIRVVDPRRIPGMNEWLSNHLNNDEGSGGGDDGDDCDDSNDSSGQSNNSGSYKPESVPAAPTTDTAPANPDPDTRHGDSGGHGHGEEGTEEGHDDDDKDHASGGREDSDDRGDGDQDHDKDHGPDGPNGPGSSGGNGGAGNSGNGNGNGGSGPGGDPPSPAPSNSGAPTKRAPDNDGDCHEEPKDKKKKTTHDDDHSSCPKAEASSMTSDEHVEGIHRDGAGRPLLRRSHKISDDSFAKMDLDDENEKTELPRRKMNWVIIGPQAAIPALSDSSSSQMQLGSIFLTKSGSILGK